MSLRSLEAEILAELRHFTGNRKIRQKDIMEWSSGPITAQGDEKLVKLPSGYHICYVEPAAKAAK